MTLTFTDRSFFVKLSSNDQIQTTNTNYTIRILPNEYPKRDDRSPSCQAQGILYNCYMATHQQWKDLTQNKIETVRRLIDTGEWVLAAEYMGYTLECALKATCCKTLNIPNYPPIKPSNNAEMGFFKTHEFDSLLIFSGLSDVLGPVSMTWGIFTSNYSGDWPQIIRYDSDSDKKYTEPIVKQLYDVLYERDDSILKTIFRNSGW